MIGRKAETVLNRAVRYAVEHEHEYFTLEHVLWSLLAETVIVETVRACGGDGQRIRKDLEVYLETEIPRAPKASPGERAAKEGRGNRDEGPAEHPVATLSIQRLIQRALFQVQSAGKEEIQPVDLFVALFQAKDSHALHLLSRQGIERLDVLSYVSHGEVRDRGRADADPIDSDESGESGSEGGEGREMGDENENPFIQPGYRSNGRASSSPNSSGTGRAGGASASGGKSGAGGEDPLALYAMNLNERARQGKIDPLVGRQHELDRMIQTLCRRRKNNPLLVGEAGVGKTALAEGLALRVVEKNVPDLLKDAVVYALDMGALLAGAKFRGDFEQRLKKVLQALQRKRDAGLMPVLLIDEIHTIIGAGAVSGGALDAANLLKPLLSQGEIRCIGSTTYAEYRNTFEKDHALVRRFQKIDVVEPTVEEAVQILNGLKAKFEEHHGILYTSEAVRAAVELSSKHLTERFLPDKAIDVIDEAGAKARLRRAALAKMTPAEVLTATEADGGKDSTHVIDHGFIEEIIAQIARIPARSVSTSQKERLKSLERDLKLSIFGQDHAIDALVVSIRLARSGLRSGERPVGSFLFCGPTGVGKTELSKQLSHCMGVPFLRFDMSEYGEKHTVSRLIGAPPGYVGFEQPGLLTEALMKTPHAVVLLDEIEKAHADIWNILLQVMDHGVLTDNNGRKADFRNAILIMTSNVGSREMERRSLGLVPGDAAQANAQKAVETTFSPEFRNRLDSIVYFNALDPLTVGQVVGKQLVELESQLLAKHVDLEVSAEAREWLAHKGYDRRMGARPMNRLIQDKIKKPLAEEILFGKLEHGGEVKVFVKEGELSFEIIPKPATGDEAGDHSGHATSDASATVDSGSHHD
jgi:ATP-dependent Clp protease ATP-binding subunit ClpA